MTRAMLAAIGLSIAVGGAAQADPADYPYPGIVEIETPHGFDALYDRMVAAIEAHEMLVLAKPSASRGAAGRGIEIPGNAVIETYRNDFAVRMLEASIPAGIEAPLRYYLTENADGTARITYRQPSAVFAPYGSAALDSMAGELDAILAAIAADAAATD
ncbi:MAG: DUF302 domain-containing protein [Alphaproteobacteria bacterium]